MKGRFQRFLILLIFVGAILLPWVYKYLCTFTSSSISGAVVDLLIVPKSRNTTAQGQGNDNINIVAVACEDRLNELIVLVKSIILTSEHYGIKWLNLVLFTDRKQLLDLEIRKLRKAGRFVDIDHKIHSVRFPSEEWKGLFQPCASQRLFLHNILPDINEILYMDTDTIVVGDLREVWAKFRQMSGEQAVGIAAEHEHGAEKIGWYNKHARHPYYPPLGLNTGVMLMNLTRLRTSKHLKWDQSFLDSYEEFKDKILFGDQDLVNIVFNRIPDAVYLLPCSFNYHTDHCIIGRYCESAQAPEGNGIQIMHGNRQSFQRKSGAGGYQQVFRKLYEYYEKFNMDEDDFIRDLVKPFKRYMESTKHVKNEAKPGTECNFITEFLFKFYKLKKKNVTRV